VSESWIEPARRTLLERRVNRAGWGYREHGDVFVEPTVLASLALLATDVDRQAPSLAREAADWLAGIQRPDGALGPSAELKAPGWGTAYAVLLWAALGTHRAQRKKAVQWLLGLSGTTLPIEKRGVAGHDTSIRGWPWVENTHAWLEPTALAVLALRREGLSNHQRASEGVRLISNRAITNSGWNYGNVATFGTPLHPQPAPTGLALLALAGLDVKGNLVDAGCRYLLENVPRVRSPRSLSWGLLGLTAWRRRPDPSHAWLAESFDRVGDGPAAALDMAQLLLASSGRTLGLLGIEAAQS
jgi:hypothetical protein